jgi:hypothetical protein
MRVDTFRDASQAGYDRYGLDRPFLTPKIERRDLERLTALAATLTATGAPPQFDLAF